MARGRECNSKYVARGILQVMEWFCILIVVVVT